MSVSIICPLYNAEDYINDLYIKLLAQKEVDVAEVKFILTECHDKTEEKLIGLGANYKKIKKEEFSHSITRENEAFSAIGDIIVFITQDIKIIDELWLKNLVSGIENGECEASFSRQIGYENHRLERYIREVNYPDRSRVVSKVDIKNLGIMTFFYSDTSSAIRKDIFIELNGYDNKYLPTNEDMYIAYKIINSGYRIKYESESLVIHSHEFSLRDVYKRYVDIGMFFKQNSYFNKYKASKRGVRVLNHVIKRSIEERKYFIIFEAGINFFLRFLGMRIGGIKFKEEGF